MADSGSGSASAVVTPPEGGDPYAGIYQAVGVLLGKDDSYATSPSGLLMLTTGNAVREWLPRLPCLTNGTSQYADISTADKGAFDAGIAEIIARRIERREASTANDGQGLVSEERSDKFTRKYAKAAPAAPAGASVDSQEAIAAAYAQWNTIECIATANRNRAGAAFGFLQTTRTGAACPPYPCRSYRRW